jgi:hypothetical protein
LEDGKQLFAQLGYHLKVGHLLLERKFKNSLESINNFNLNYYHSTHQKAFLNFFRFDLLQLINDLF